MECEKWKAHKLITRIEDCCFMCHDNAKMSNMTREHRGVTYKVCCVVNIFCLKKSLHNSH